jgi:hypothetical protein
MTPTQIFRKSEAAWQMVKIVGLLFWLPILALIVLGLFYI